MQLDHLVVAVPDLEAAMATFTTGLGVESVLGGRHEGLGTHNAVLPLEGDAYIELIAKDPTRPDPPHARPFGLDEFEGMRLATFALRSFDLDASVERARARGVDAGIVVPVSRALPDGGRIEWRLTLSRDAWGGGVVPFLIDWADAPHPSRRDGSRAQLLGLSGVHPEPRRVREALAAFDFEFEVSEGAVPSLEARVRGPAGEITIGG